MTSDANHIRVGRWIVPIFLAAFVAQIWLADRLENWVHPVPFTASRSGTLDPKIVSSLRAAALLTGYKVLIGHAFWIEVIQYYADWDNAVDHFSKLYDYCRLASDLNPEFIPVYTYGAAALAYQLHRLDEAVKLLQKGILANPKENRLKLMLAAIEYHYQADYKTEIPFLEYQISQGNAPTMLINILANTYMKVGRDQDAIRLWQHILATTNSDSQKYEAAQKLKVLYQQIAAGDKTKRSSK